MKVKLTMNGVEYKLGLEQLRDDSCAVVAQYGEESPHWLCADTYVSDQLRAKLAICHGVEVRRLMFVDNHGQWKGLAHKLEEMDLLKVIGTRFKAHRAWSREYILCLLPELFND